MVRTLSTMATTEILKRDAKTGLLVNALPPVHGLNPVEQNLVGTAATLLVPTR
jgi:hypothetical protein